MYEINNYQRRNQYRLVPKMVGGGTAASGAKALGKSGLGLIDKSFRWGVRNIKRAYNKWFGESSKEASKAASGNAKAAGNTEKASTTGTTTKPNTSRLPSFELRLREDLTFRKAYNEANRRLAEAEAKGNIKEAEKWHKAMQTMKETGKPYNPNAVVVRQPTAVTEVKPKTREMVHQPGKSKGEPKGEPKGSTDPEEELTKLLYPPKTKSSWRKRALWGLGAAGTFGTAYFLTGDSKAQTPVESTIDDIDVNGPAVVETGGGDSGAVGGDSGAVGGDTGSAVGKGDATATDAREIESSTRLGDTSANTSSANASTNSIGRKVIKRSIYDTMPLMNRRDVRHVLRDLTGRAYTSSAVELVNSLGMTEDTNPFKRALMNRLGVKNWNNRLVLQKLGEKGIHGTLGGSDRKRIRNLINNGTLIDGSIRYYKKNGGTLKLLPKKY